MTKGRKPSPLCLDCGVDILEAPDYYMLKDEIWCSIVPDRRGMLCIHCAEKRLGRELTHADFAEIPLNEAMSTMNPELAERYFSGV
jgi:hypothetical protein